MVEGRRGCCWCLCVWRGEGEEGGREGGGECVCGGGGGGGGADRVYDTHVCPCAPTRVQLIELGWCQCTSPFGWTDQPENSPTPVPSEGRFQASPKQNLTQPQVEEKNCEARPPHPPLLRRKGGAIFSISWSAM